MTLSKNFKNYNIGDFSYEQDVRKAFVYIPEKYESYFTRKLIGELTKNGNKLRARKMALYIVDQLLEKLELKNVLELQEQFENLIILSYEFKPYRLGAYKYKIPLNISYDKARKQGYKRCFKIALQNKKIDNACDKIIAEIVDVIGQNTGATINRLNELRKLAQLNKAYQYLIAGKRR